MFDKRDLMFSSIEHEKANERIEKELGNYIYIAKHKPCKNASWDRLLQRWIVEWEREASAGQMRDYCMVFVRRQNT